MKHINVEHISLTNIPKQKDDYSFGVFVCLYSYCAYPMINEDISNDEWCDAFCSITMIYIYAFCLRLQYDEASTMNKSTYS